MAERVQDIQCKEKGEKSRIQVVAETKSKRKKSGEKKRKRKYKALEEAKKAEMEAASGAEGIDAELKSS